MDLIVRHSKADMPATRSILQHVQIEYERYDHDTFIATPPSYEEKLRLDYFSEHLRLSPGTKVLLHSCCAPCSGAMVEEMKFHMNLDVTIFFYNPNIHPKKEYEIRKNENINYAVRHGIPFVDCDYDAESWFKRMVGFELEPERGVRCSACFDMRMEVTAAYAAQHSFAYFTTTNATSRWKDEAQVNLAGVRAAQMYSTPSESVQFWVYNWKTDSMTQRKYEVSVQERFYKQEYCGCAYSLRDSNVWRAQQGIAPVSIGGDTAGLGTRYFEDAAADAAEESQEVVDSFFRDAQAGFGDTDRTARRQAKVSLAASRSCGQTTFTQRLKSADDSSTALNNW